MGILTVGLSIAARKEYQHPHLAPQLLDQFLILEGNAERKGHIIETVTQVNPEEEYSPAQLMRQYLEELRIAQLPVDYEIPLVATPWIAGVNVDDRSQRHQRVIFASELPRDLSRMSLLIQIPHNEGAFYWRMSSDLVSANTEPATLSAVRTHVVRLEAIRQGFYVGAILRPVRSLLS